MDFLSSLRLRSLFGGTPQPTPYQNVNFDTSGGDETPYNVDDRMKQLYTPETQATDAYNALVQNKPEYERPSFLRTIAASLSAFGAGGPKAGDDVMNWHNDQNLNDWKNSLAPAQHAADLERQNNVNERTLAHQTVSDELRNRADIAKDKQATKANEIREHRAAIYEFKALHPTMKIIMPKGGNVTAVDPTTGESHDLGIPTGSLSETDKLNLTQEHKLEQIEAQTQGQKDVEGVRQGGRTELAETRGWQLGSIPDPNDPTKQIGVKINQITGDIVPIKFGDKNPVFTKAGTPGAGGKGVQPPNLQEIQDKSRETLGVIDQLLDAKTGKLTPFGSSAVGANRILPIYKIPGSQGKTADIAINNLKSRLVIDLIGQMKAQSRTGATGFGALNVKELGVLENAIGQLDPNMQEDAFAAELKRIRDKIARVLQPSDGMNPTVTSKPTTPLTEADVQRLRDKYLPKGGQ